MNFYRRRPLVLIFTLCIAVFAACAFLPLYMKIAFLALVAVALPAALIWIKHHAISHICNMPARAFASIAAAFVMSAVFLCVGYYDVHAARFARLSEGEITAVVADVQGNTPYLESFTVRILAVDGERYRGKGILRFEESTGFASGDVIRVRASFVPLEEVYTNSQASRISLLSDGYVFAADASSEPWLVGESSGVERLFLAVHRTVSSRLSLYLNRESVTIVRSLFLGEREDLGVLGRDMKYSGTSHLLALSGMHLAVLMLAADGALRHLISKRRIRCALTVALIALYVAVTGFSVSVMRAGIMMCVYCVAGCTRAESDRITTLFGAVLIIISANPAAVLDVGLQLSFFATLGVVLMAEASAHNGGRAYFIRTGLLKRTAHDFGRRIAVSLGAVFFVLPIQWAYFGWVSTASVPATLLLALLCSGVLALTLPYLILMGIKFHFAAALVGVGIDSLCVGIGRIAAFFSDCSGLIWLGYPFVLPIFLIAAAAVVYMMYKGKHSWVHALIPMCAACVVFFACACAWNAAYSERVTLDYSAQNKSDALFVMSGGVGTLIDCSDGTATTLGIAADLLDKRGESELEMLVLTALTRRHIYAVRSLLGSYKIGYIVYPRPDGEYEAYIASDIDRITEDFGGKTIVYDRADAPCVIGTNDMQITFAEPARLSRSERELLAFPVDVCGVKIAYLGACTWENDHTWAFAKDADYLIIGRRGPNIRLGPSDTLTGEKRLVFISGEENDTFESWLSDYSGRLRFGEGLGMVIDP